MNGMGFVEDVWYGHRKLGICCSKDELVYK